MSTGAIISPNDMSDGDRKPAWLPNPIFECLSDHRRVVLVLWLIAAAVRFGSLLYLGPLTEAQGDVPSYIMPGVRLANGFGYTRIDGTPAMKRAPGLPLQIALSHWLTGGLYLAFLANAAWGAAA